MIAFSRKMGINRCFLIIKMKQLTALSLHRYKLMYLCLDEVEEARICVVGEQSDEIKASSKIKYFGMVDNQKILEMEEKAKLLVNIRYPQADLTKYSLPSKILRYIAFGSIVLSIQLLEILKENFDYIEMVDISNQRTVEDTITSLLSISEEEYMPKVIAAQNFIASGKNYNKQCERIIDLLKDF